MDGNTAVAHVAYRVNEVCAIYPITPSSTMAELADQWAAEGVTNIWGNVPVVQEMQSEGGAAGAVHGALQSGALTTTFTASQGLLLMLPNMFKIAGELTATVFHVAARSVATSALSIFGDHSDVMTVRTTGFALLSSGSVQDAHDSALIAEAATLSTRVPFLHFFDGFRTSHEVNTLSLLSDADIRAMISDDLVRAHRARALNPENPFVRGTTHNPDTFFQTREAVNPYYVEVPRIVQSGMNAFARLTGRHYHLFDYEGPADAERAIVLMGSGAETARATAEALRRAGAKVGIVQVRLYRPFSAEHFLAALPESCRAIAVLEQTKEPGATGEPLYLDVVTAMAQAVARGARKGMPRVIGGRYGLSSKDFTPAMAKAVFDELEKSDPKNSFTVGITDDVSHTSLEVDPAFSVEAPSVTRAVFYRTWRRRHCRRQQEQRKDHRGGCRALHAGVLRLRFAQIGRPDSVASALWAGADPCTLSDRFGRLRRLPCVRVPGASGCIATCCAGRCFPPQQPVRRGRGVGPPPEVRATADHRQATALLRHRRVQSCTRGGSRRAHQHSVADLLLCNLRRAAARECNTAYQGSDPKELCRQRRGCGSQELRGGRRHARATARGPGSADCDEYHRSATYRAP
jgi:pyruvate/2-oxoacid:ferredoxin oxidoreductase alpha subunit